MALAYHESGDEDQEFLISGHDAGDTESSFEPSGDEKAATRNPVVRIRNRKRSLPSSQEHATAPHHPAEDQLEDSSCRNGYWTGGKIPLYNDAQIRADAITWAASFVPPDVVEFPDTYLNLRRSEMRDTGSAADEPGAPEVFLNGPKAQDLDDGYIRAYRALLNDDIKDAVNRGVKKSHYNDLRDTQVGCCLWTASEKDAFFTALGRLGKDNICGIARRINTKSALEVRGYIQLLHNAYINHHRQGKHLQLLNPASFPAANEISEQCRTVLNRAALALARRQDKREEKLETKRWGDMCLLTEGVSQKLERDIVDNQNSEGIMPAVKHLHLGNWLLLQERVFMNAGKRRRSENYTAMAHEGEEISIRAEAFNLFFDISKRITKELVYRTIKIAKHRLQWLRGRKKRNPNEDVRPKDVQMAIKALGMKPNSKQFWQKTARRCNLDVYELAKWNKYRVPKAQLPLSYDTVERALALTAEEWRERERTLAAQDENQSTEFMEDAVSDSDISSVGETNASLTSAEGRISDPDFERMPVLRPYEKKRRHSQRGSFSEPTPGLESDLEVEPSTQVSQKSESLERDERLKTTKPTGERASASASKGHHKYPTPVLSKLSLRTKNALSLTQASAHREHEESTKFMRWLQGDIEQDLAYCKIKVSKNDHGKKIMKKICQTNELNQKQICYTHLTDAKESLIEEQRISELLNIKTTIVVDPEKLPLPQEPMPVRKELDELVDWRDRIRYLAPWETLIRPIPEVLFDTHRRRTEEKKVVNPLVITSKSGSRSTVMSVQANDEITGEDQMKIETFKPKKVSKKREQPETTRPKDIPKKRKRSESSQPKKENKHQRKSRKAISAEVIVDSDNDAEMYKEVIEKD